MVWVFFSCKNYKIQVTTRYKLLQAFSTWWVYMKGWVHVGLGRGLCCRTGKGDVPRLILAPCWEDLRCYAKALSSKGGWKCGQGRSLWYLDAHLSRESRFAAHSVTGAIFLAHCEDTLVSLFLTTWEDSFFAGFLCVCAGVDELMWYDSIATIAENTGRMACFFQDTPSCSNIYLACWSINASCVAVTDFLIEKFC